MGSQRVRMSGREWLLLVVLAGVQFTNVLDFMIVMPLGEQYSAKMNLSPSQFGLVVSMYGYCAGAAGLLLSRFMDRFDRKQSLLVLYTGFTAATFLCALADRYVLLLFARGLAGAFGGLIGAAVLAIVGDAFHDARRGTAMGAVMSAFSVASIVGMPAGLELARAFGWWAPFVGIGTLCLLVLVAAVFVLPPLRGHLGHPGRTALGVWELFSRPTFLRAYALMATLVMTGFMLFPFFAIYVVNNVKRPNSELKYLYLVGGVATIVSMNVIGRLADRFGKLRVFRVLALLTIIPFVLYTNLPPVPLAVLLMVSTLMMVTTSGRMVPGTALITASAAPHERGQFLSINAVVQHVTSGLAASVGGWIIGQNAAGELTNVPVVGLLAVGFIVASVILAGQLRPAAGGPAAPAAREPEPLAEAISV